MKKKKGYFQYETDELQAHRSLGTYLNKRKFRDSRLDHFANNRRRKQWRTIGLSAMFILLLGWLTWQSVQGIALYFTSNP